MLMVESLLCKRRVRYGVLAVLLCLSLLSFGACAPVSHSAVGHSYSLSNASDYVSHDDDGDLKDITVDVIEPVETTKLVKADVVSFSDALINGKVATHYRAASNVNNQIAQVKLAVNNYSTLICIPADNITEQNAQQWLDALKFARKTGVAVALIADEDNGDIVAKNVPVDSVYFAAIWIINSSQTQTMTPVNAVQTIVEDKPHETIVRTTLR